MLRKFSTLLLLLVAASITHTMEESNFYSDDSNSELLDFGPDVSQALSDGQDERNLSSDTSDDDSYEGSSDDSYAEMMPIKRVKIEASASAKKLDRLQFLAACAMGKHLKALHPEQRKAEFQKIIEPLCQENKEYAGSIIEAYLLGHHQDLEFLIRLIEQQPKNQDDIVRCYYKEVQYQDISDIEDLSAAGYGNFYASNALMSALLNSGSRRYKYLEGALFKNYYRFCNKTYTEKEQLMEAAIVDDVNNFKRLFSNNSESIDDTLDSGCLAFTLLTEAVNNDNKEIVKLLLQAGANANKPCGDGSVGQRYEYPLMLAARNGNSAMVELLLNPDNYIKHDMMPDINTTTPLFASRTYSDEGFTALHYAAQNGDGATIQQLLDHNASTTILSNDDITILMSAAKGGNKAFVSRLLDQGADVNAKSVNNQTALMFACEHGYDEVVALLLEKGADVTVLSTKRKTALHMAAENGHNKIIKLILAVDTTTINTQDTDGFTPLMRASSRSWQKSVKLLLKSSANPNLATANRRTALMLACGPLRDNTKIIELLLAHGADANAINSFRRNALMDAAEGLSADIVRLLVAHTQNIDALDGDKRSALLIACASHDRDDIVNILLAHGADKKLKDRLQMTAFGLALKHEHEKIKSLLKKH